MYGKLLALLALAKAASAANILALMVVASHSHHIWNARYLEALVERGHHVTYFGVDEYKNRPPNVSQILVEGLYDFFDYGNLVSLSNIGPYRNILYLSDWDDAEAGYIAKSPAVKQLELLVKEKKFDLIIQDIGAGSFLLGAVDIAGRPPIVGITAFGVPPWALEILGSPMTYSTNPYFYSTYSDSMTLLERTNNYFLHLFSFAVRWFSMRYQNEIAKNCFGNKRSLEEILQDLNVIMVNSNPGLDYPLPEVPGLIPIGGLHIQQPKPLPQELKTFLDNAKHGVVYFSLGTNIKSTLTKEKFDVLLKAFGELAPIQVLWKCEAELVPERPKNVRMEKWFQQNDVLAHPNVRLFFTHSGMLSTQEAVYHGKPMIGMPFFLDQPANLQKCVRKGFCEKISYEELDVKKVVTTIRQVLDDPRYAKNAKKASVIFKDEMEHPIKRAVFWTEYAMRHDGAPHLRQATRNLHWFQNWMLDIITLTLAFAFVIFYTIHKTIRVVISKLCAKDTPKVKKN